MKSLQNENADIGVGTLIIFITMVLVAAVAATVLIYTTGVLQQKAIKTSAEATKQVSSNINVVKVLGDRLNSTLGIQPGIQGFIIRIEPAAGTTSIDLRQVLLIEIASDYRRDLNYTNIGRLGSYGVYNIVRDADRSFSVNTPVLNSGDLVDIDYYTSNYTLPLLMPRQTITLSLNQEFGASVNLEITAPNSFGVNRFVVLYP